MANFEDFTNMEMNTIREILQAGQIGEFSKIIDRWANSVAFEEYEKPNDMTWRDKENMRKSLQEDGFDLLYRFAKSYVSELRVKIADYSINK
jgi:hypothetical protein